MIAAIDVAYYFLSLANEEVGDLISNLKLQKLLYYAQGFNLALYGERLFPEDIKAWEHGPVVPEVYHAFKDYGANAIPFPEDLQFDGFTPETEELLDEVYAVYGQFSAWKLRNMTHDEAPWRETERSQTISPEKMTTYFKTQLITD